jgi:glucokinase
MNAPDPSRMPASAEATLPWLVADIGGTNARFGWVESPNSGVAHIRTIPVADHPGPGAAAAAYLSTLPGNPQPRRAALALATAVHAETIELTNSAWRFNRHELRAELGVQSLTLLNDFEALALSLPKLGAHQLRQWQAAGAAACTPDVQPAHSGTLAVVGPGTGLGVGAVAHTSMGWHAIPGEGGHATLAPMDAFESELLDLVRREHPHVSAERLLSGIGLPLLHRSVATLLGHQTPEASAEQIVQRGVSGEDAVCGHTLDTFCALLGGFAGNVALTLGARGGVYIGGGIVPRFGERFFASRFRDRFEAKGRFRSYLQDIPTPLITDTLAALTGACFALEQSGQTR